MSRWTTPAIKAALILIPLWFAFMLPRWLDSSFYDQCPSFNCFTSPQTYLVSLALGLSVGVALNVIFTLWVRSRHPSVADDS